MFWSNEHSRISASGEKSFTLYVFETLELRRAAYGDEHDDANSTEESDYEVSHYTLSPYLLAHGVRLARLVYEGSGAVPDEATGTGEGEVNGSTSELHVFFELGDHLGSTSVVLDKATGELVERSTFEGYGGTESDYRPGRRLRLPIFGRPSRKAPPSGETPQGIEGGIHECRSPQGAHGSTLTSPREPRSRGALR